MQRFRLAIGATLALVVAAPASGDEFSWATAINGSFSDAARWTPAGGPPNAGDAALFAVAGTYTVSGDGTVSLFEVGGGDVTFTGNISTDDTIEGSVIFLAGGTARVSGSLTSPRSMEIGRNKDGGAGNGTLRVFSGGNVQATADFSFDDVAVGVAGLTGSTAALIVENTDSTFTAMGGLNIAGSGNASVSVFAGGELVTSGDLDSSTLGIKIAVDEGGMGSLIVEGLNAHVDNTLQMNVGQLGHGEFAVSDGGQIDSSGTADLPALVMAFDETATGIGYVYDGGTLNTTGQFVIGGGGTAEFYVQAGGSVTSNAIGTGAAIFIGNGAAANGTATMNGGTWDVNGDFFIGGEGFGSVTVDDGATLDVSQANSLLTLGFQDGGLGELFVLGGQLLRPDTSTAITVGIGGRGRFEIREGSDVLDSKLRIAQIESSSLDPSEVIVSDIGSTLTLTSELAVGIEDAGQLRVQDGGNVSVTGIDSLAEAGGGIGGFGEIFVTGDNSMLSVSGAMTLGNAGIGNLAVDTNGQVATGAATLGRLANSEGSANLESGGTWNVDGDLVVGDHGDGYFYLRQDGTLSLPSGKEVTLGQNTDGTGTFHLYGNGLLDIDTEIVVGRNGTGFFHLHDGATYDTLGDFLLGNLSTAHGELHLDTGGTFTANGDMTVGVAGEGLVVVNSLSTLDASNGSLVLGLIDGAFGEVIVDAGELLRPTAGITIIGLGGRGRMEIGGGAVVDDGSVRVAQIPSTGDDASELIVDGTGTTYALSGSLDLGIEDRGDLTVRNGGQMNVASGLVAGIADVGEGHVTVTGDESKLEVTGPLILAESGLSFAGVDTNGTLETGQATLGRFVDSEASMDVASGGMWTVHGNLFVGDSGAGYVYLRPGGTIAVDAGSQLILGNQPGSSGIFNIFEDGALNTDSDIVIGYEGTGSLNLFDGATYNSLGDLALGELAGASGNISVNSQSIMTVNGDLTMAEDIAATGGLTVDGANSVLSVASLYVGGSQTDAGGLAVVYVDNQGQIHVDGRLNIWGGGAVNLAGGSITVGSDMPTAAADTVRVNPLGELSGSGVINGDVVNAGGTVAPGSSAGILAITGDYTQATGGKLQAELAGTVPGSLHDQLAIDGSAVIDGALQVTLLDEFPPIPGDSFAILTAAAGVSGTFANGTLPTLVGLNWQLEYDTNAVLLHVALTGDYNRDGFVNAADYTVWRNSLNQSGLALAADGNSDGVITQLDFNVWKSNYGNTAGSGANVDRTATVPEPGSTVLMVVSSLVLLGVRPGGKIRRNC